MNVSTPNFKPANSAWTQGDASPHQFDEHHPEFKGFSAFYDAEIHPALLADEIQRLRELKRLKVMRGMIAVFLIAVLIPVGISMKNSGPTILTIAISLLVFLALGDVFRRPKTTKLHVGFKTKKNIVGGVCRFLEWTFETDLAISPHIEMFTSLGLITSNFQREIYEDRMYGEAHGATFEFYEAHLLARHGHKKDNKWKTQFRGQFVVFNFYRESLGRTVVFRDKGLFNPKTKDGMKRVGLVDPMFESIFEAYSTDQVEARYLMDPVFIQRLVDLERSIDGENIRFGFTGKHLLVAIENGNRFEAGTMLRPLTDPARTQNILDDIGTIFSVIDGVKKRPLSIRI